MRLTRSPRPLVFLLVTLTAASATAKSRVLYYEGEPHWEMKFVHRAVQEGPIQLVSLATVGENKFLRRDVDEPSELAWGFPSTSEELQRYQGVILGGVGATSLEPEQHDLLLDYVRSGGALMILGGQHALAEGGWTQSPLAEALPVLLDDEDEVEPTAPMSVTVFATDEGIDEPGLLFGDAVLEGFVGLPELTIMNRIGGVVSDAQVLISAHGPEGREPILITRDEGRGRIAVFRAHDSWKWQMQRPLEDRVHEVFWQRLLAWLVDRPAPDEVPLNQPRQLAPVP